MIILDFNLENAKLISLNINLVKMLDIAFWYYLIGIFALTEGLLFMFMPKEAKRLLKGMTRRVSNMRMAGFVMLFVAMMIWYSSNFDEGVAATILLVFSYLLVAKVLLLIYAPRWMRKTVVKSVLKWKELYYQLGGVLLTAVGIISSLYGALYI